MRGERRQIVAFGGGGFSMERGQHAARRLRPVADPQATTARLLPADRQRGRRPLHRPLLPGLRRSSLRAVAHLAVPARAGGRRHARAAAEQRPDLRGRRQRDQPARHMACARARRDAAACLGARRRPVRAERGVAVLVRGGRDRLPRAGRGDRGDRPAALEQLRALRRRAGTLPRLPRPPRRRDGRGLCGRGRGRPALRGRAAHARGQLQARGARPTACAGPATGSAAGRCRPTTWAWRGQSEQSRAA